MAEACAKRVAACEARGATLTFSVEQCARIASSVQGSMRDWALEAMSGLDGGGHPTREGCTLEYVTVYQPWPKNWWGGANKPKKP
jgi:hypothetical protein